MLEQAEDLLWHRRVIQTRTRSAKTIRAGTRWSTIRDRHHKVYPIPVKHHGINSITPDEAKVSPFRLAPTIARAGRELDLSHSRSEDGKSRERVNTQHIYGFIVLDILDGRITRCSAGTSHATIRRPIMERLADDRRQAARGRFASCRQGRASDQLGRNPGRQDDVLRADEHESANCYDLTATGDTIGRDLGPLCRAR